MHAQVIYISIVDISIPNGQGIYAKKTLEALLEKDIYTQIIIPKPRNKISLPINNKANFFYLPEKKMSRDVFWHFKLQLILFFTLLKKIRKNDKIIYSNKPSMFAVFLLKRIKHFKTYVLIEGLSISTISTVLPPIFKNLGLYVLQSNMKDATICFPAYISALEWAKKYNKNSVLFPCGVDTRHFKPQLSVKHNNINEVFTIGYVGSFRKVHYLKELITATMDLPVKVILIGEGKQLNELKDYVVKNKATEKIQFKKNIPQHLIPSSINSCNLMWGATDPNHWGIPIKVIEYLACNKKVLFTKRIDHNFIEENGWGLALSNLNTNNLKNIIENILKLYKNGEWSDNVNSYKFVKEKFNWSNYLKSVDV